MTGRGYTARSIRNIVPNVKATLMNATGEGEIIDVLGEIRQIEKGLAFLRQGSQVEFEDRMQGTRWRITIPIRNERSYNTSSLIGKFAAANKQTLWDAFVTLWRGDVIRIEWQYKKLLRMAKLFDVSLTTAHHEIVDGDEEDIGEYPATGYPRYESIE